MTQPSARPCWRAATRPETSVKITPENMPQHAPAKVTQVATARKLPEVATPIAAKRQCERSADQEPAAAPSIGPGAGEDRRDAPGDRADRDQVGHQRHADGQVARHVEQERRARGAAGGGGEHAERRGQQQRPRHPPGSVARAARPAARSGEGIAVMESNAHRPRRLQDVVEAHERQLRQTAGASFDRLRHPWSLCSPRHLAAPPVQRESGPTVTIQVVQPRDVVADDLAPHAGRSRRGSRPAPRAMPATASPDAGSRSPT